AGAARGVLLRRRRQSEARGRGAHPRHRLFAGGLWRSRLRTLPRAARDAGRRARVQPGLESESGPSLPQTIRDATRETNAVALATYLSRTCSTTLHLRAPRRPSVA